ncbi:MAG: hypothetical protein QMC94_08450 [Anaerosomatales bacterium]|nr:hypothetical protein [Anaerosomatales bacterium]
MMSFDRRAAAWVATLAFILAVAASPVAAYARVAEYQVQFLPVGQTGSSEVIVNVILSPEESLPATVTVPLPAGAQVLWSGEILGGDPANDPFRQPSVVPTAGALAAVFRLEQKPIAQVEASIGEPQVRGSRVSSKLAWVNAGEEGTYTFSVVVEAGATDVEISPKPVGEPQTNAKGETLYVLSPVRLAAGQKFDVSVSYNRAGASGAASSRGTSPVLLVAVAGLVLAVAALVVVARRERAQSA